MHLLASPGLHATTRGSDCASNPHVGYRQVSSLLLLHLIPQLPVESPCYNGCFRLDDLLRNLRAGNPHYPRNNDGDP
jgi:hypothetical protein